MEVNVKPCALIMRLTQDVIIVFIHIFDTHDRLDILVNSALGGYAYINGGTEFWFEEGF